jgi:L-lactate dehydrogenase complex protein LldG
MATDEARRAILGAIRRSLTESAPHDVVHAERHEPPTPGQRTSLPILTGVAAAPAPPVAQSPPAVPLDLFRARLEAVAGTFTMARGAADVARELAEILRRVGARRVAASDSPRVRPLVEEACALAGADLVVDAAPGDLFDCDVGVSGAQWGIAETGTLVLESARERHRFVSLIPRVHVALLRADRICETLGEALRETRAEAAPGQVPSAAITLVTGPSRTSDIELTLAIGVHGPQELHVIVLEPAASSPDAPTASALGQP